MITKTIDNRNVMVVSIIYTETESKYVMVESTLWFDDVGVVQGLLQLLPAVQRSRMWSRKWIRRQPGNEVTSLLYGVKIHSGSCDCSAYWSNHPLLEFFLFVLNSVHCNSCQTSHVPPEDIPTWGTSYSYSTVAWDLWSITTRVRGCGYQP